ncbi:hypothetical protein ACGFIG_10465 [Micromonospora sp. NPDC049048]|uniref:hypothetical protein n=1 Tax=Micromonospora sp. NPDC049048 TaxID=3364263 RepID=UPI0037107CB3
MSYPQPAGTALRRLAARLTFSPCDHVPGHYDLVHHHQRDTQPADGIAVRDVVRWRADDGSGAHRATTHPPGLAAAATDWWWPGYLPPELSFSRPFTHTNLLRSELGLTGTPPTNAREVLRHLAYLLTWYSPRRDARAATLTVLASLDGLLYHPHVSDEAGRRGIGITTTGDKRRDLLVLHPQTAEVLAYESAIRTRSGWQPQVYILYLTHSHTSGRWWEPAHPPPPHPATARRLYPRPQQHQLPTSIPPCHTTTTQGAPR